MKKEMIDKHLLHVVKNTTPLQRMIWLKKQVDFWKMMEIKRLSKNTKSGR